MDENDFPKPDVRKGQPTPLNVPRKRQHPAAGVPIPDDATQMMPALNFNEEIPTTEAPAINKENSVNPEDETLKLDDQDEKVATQLPVVTQRTEQGQIHLNIHGIYERLADRKDQPALPEEQKQIQYKKILDFAYTRDSDGKYPRLRELLEYTMSVLNIRVDNQPKSATERDLARSMETVFMGFNLLDAISETSLGETEKDSILMLILKKVGREHINRIDKQRGS